MAKVLKTVADVISVDTDYADAYVQTPEFGSQSELWITFDIRYPSARLAFWETPEDSPYFIGLLEEGLAGLFDVVSLSIAIRDTGSGPGWCNVAGGTPPPSTADTWHTVEYHYKDGDLNGQQIYVDGSLIVDLDDGGFGSYASMRLGQDLYNASPTYSDPYVDSDPIYFRNVKVGTTRGGSDIFADDFSSGDLAAWDVTVGDVSVVDDPFAPETVTDFVDISLAPDDLALAPSPTWERIDTTYNVQRFQIDRGRANEFGKIGPGTATIDLIDLYGDFDPTNTGGAFFGRQTTGEPMGFGTQAAISLRNPVTLEWSMLFRGFISRVHWTPHETERFAFVRLELVDALGYIAGCEMPLDGSFGDDVLNGNIVFDEDTSTDAVQTRINAILDSLGWDTSLRSIFTGNVQLQETTYAPRTSVLTAIQDAADAEFVDVAVVYAGGPRAPGSLIFHGRLARFDPTNPDYDLETWQLGDATAADLSPATVVKVSPPLEAYVDDANVYTSALATPQNIDDGDIAGQYVTNAIPAATKGLRTWSAENLATRGGVATDALQETKLFADYIRDNYDQNRVRIGQVTVKGRDPNGIYGLATWNLLCGIDLSDVCHVKTTHGGGGGFDTDFYVEGIHYTATPGPAGRPTIELTLDLSPAGVFDSNPFED